MKGILNKKAILFKTMITSLSLSIVGSWGAFYWLTTSIGDVNLSMEGLSTCFSRVSQNYSGKMIGPNQPYTSSSFYKVTEECFSDLEKVISNSFFIKLNKSVTKNFEELVKKSYWFHRDSIVENEFTAVKDGKVASMTKNFQEIESVYELISEEISSIRSELNSRKKWVFSLGLFSVLSMAFISLFGLSRKDNERFASASIDNVSHEEIEKLTRPLVGQITGTTQETVSKSTLPDQVALSLGPEKFDTFFNRFLRLIAPRLIRKGVNFDFSVDTGIPRVVNPEQTHRNLEIFFERAMNFNLSGGRVTRIDCYQLHSKKTELRFYDNGVCLINSLKNFKNVRASNGLVLGVEMKHIISSSKKGKIKSILKGKKKDLMRELQI